MMRTQRAIKFSLGNKTHANVLFKVPPDEISIALNELNEQKLVLCVMCYVSSIYIYMYQYLISICISVLIYYKVSVQTRSRGVVHN